MEIIPEQPSKEVSRDSQSQYSENSSNNLDSIALMSEISPLNQVEEEIKHDEGNSEVLLLSPTEKLVSTDLSKQKHKSYDWDAGDDVDEMNIGETKTDFAIHGIADCQLTDFNSGIPALPTTNLMCPTRPNMFLKNDI